MSEFHLFYFSSYLKSWQLMDAFLECFYKNEKYLFKILKKLFLHLLSVILTLQRI